MEYDVDGTLGDLGGVVSWIVAGEWCGGRVAGGVRRWESGGWGQAVGEWGGLAGGVRRWESGGVGGWG